MTIADQLGTTYFQLSSVGVGALAVGIADIRQRINNLLNNIPGTDPLRPTFGCNAYKYADAPLTVAIPNIKKEIFDSISFWMPEIQVDSITHTIIDAGHVLFNVNYSVVDSTLTDTVTYSNGILGGSAIQNAIIISAPVPAPITNGIYRASFVLDGNNATPLMPSVGFSSAPDMLTWINNNWAAYGKWYLTGTSLVLYLNTALATTVNLTVTETAQVTLQALIPQMDTGEYYDVVFTAGGAAPSPGFSTGMLATPGALLSWVQANWGSYGNWSIASTTTGGINTGDFNYDFSGDFSTDSLTTDYYLVYQSADYNVATLSIS